MGQELTGGALRLPTASPAPFQNLCATLSPFAARS